MKLIGVAGQFRNGKDMISDYLADKLQLKRAAFASNVKKIFCETFNVDFQFVEEWKTIPEPPPGFSMPVRQALQFIGDGFRKIKNDIWVDLIFRYNPSELVVSDVRYINELNKIKENKGVNILVHRPGFLNFDPNESEAQIRPFVEYYLSKNIEGRVYDSDDRFKLIDYFIINDGTLEDLYKKIDNIIL
jgi:hypothetical protein